MLRNSSTSFRSRRGRWKGEATKNVQFMRGRRLEYYLRSPGVLSDVFDRPSRVGVQTYIASLGRAEQKLQNLNSTNFRINREAMAELGNLLAYGRQQLQDYFEQLLREDAHVIEPLNFITKRSSFCSYMI